MITPIIIIVFIIVVVVVICFCFVFLLHKPNSKDVFLQPLSVKILKHLELLNTPHLTAVSLHTENVPVLSGMFIVPAEDN